MSDATRTGQPASGSIQNPHYWWYVARADLLERVFRPFVPREALVLDVGSADGPSVAWLDEMARRVPVDIDVSGLGPGGVCCDGTALPFRAGSFDVVAAFDVVEHFEDESAILSELARVLRPGGTLLVAVPAYEWAWSSFDVSAGHHRRYTRRRARRSLQRHGLVIRRTTYAFMATFPFFAVDRIRTRVGGQGERATTSTLPNWAARLLRLLTRFDALLLPHLDLPLGSSVFVAATRPASEPA